MSSDKINSIEDHEYDGIKELDNKPPAWIMWVFYITVAFSVFYMVYYSFSGYTQDGEYASEVKAAKNMFIKEDKPLTEADIKITGLKEDVEEGKKLYASKNCFTCHGHNGEGNAVGPNLTDNAWMHGNTPKEVFNIIKIGNPTKGMLAFKDQLSDREILKITNYILVGLVGSNPANAKAPQGTVIEK